MDFSFVTTNPTWQTVLEITAVVLATVLSWLVIRLFGWIMRRLRTRLSASAWIKTWQIQRLKILSEETLRTSIGRGLYVLQVVGVFALLYLYVALVLSLFRTTQPLAGKLLTTVGEALSSFGASAVAYLPNLVVIVVASVIVYYTIRMVRFLGAAVRTGQLVLPGFYAEWGRPTAKLASFLVVVVGLVVVFPYLPGAKSPAFRGISIFVGVLLSLGSTSAISNLIAGVILTYTRAFDLGDRVKIADTVGDVVERTLLVTRIRTIKNVEITIPNAAVLGAHIVNYSSVSHEQDLIVHTAVTIGYDAPWPRVHEALLAAAEATPGVKPEPKPFVLQQSLGDFSVEYEINVYAEDPRKMSALLSGLHANIQDAFNRAGIEILSPRYHALRDGNSRAVPAEHLGPDYRAPAFRVSAELPR